MRKRLKSSLNYFPWLRKLAYNNYRLFNLLGAYRSPGKFKDGNIEQIFTEHYQQNVWINDESVSGDGSTVEYTEQLRSELPNLFRKFEIRSILDAPCGDYNWFQHVDRGDISYLGGDIVVELIRSNNERYGNSTTRFQQLDITTDGLPTMDLMICRDVLFHFSNKDVMRFWKNFVESDIRYILTTSHTECKRNFDILTGQFRLLNLEKPPFSFRDPLFAIDDWKDGFPVRKMLLWRREDIVRFLG